MNKERNAIVAGLAGLAMLAVPSLAQAAQGFIVSQTSLRAGPGGQFPYVDRLAAGAPVTVFGCLGGRSWCDVSFQGDRGWVSGNDLEIFFNNRRVRIVEVTPTFIPVETFSVAIYWDRYYRSKPFFADRDRFASVNVNINGGGKVVSGRTGGRGEVTAAAGSGKVTESKTGSTNGHVLAKGNAACPAGQKNCKTPVKSAGGTPAKTVAGANAMVKEKTANVGKTATSGQVAGSIAPKGIHKKCKPGAANCAPGASGGNAG